MVLSTIFIHLMKPFQKNKAQIIGVKNDLSSLKNSS